MKEYSREEVINASTDYFKGDDLAAEVFTVKYALRGKNLEWLEDTPDKMHKRLAREFSRIENKYKNPLSKKEIYYLLKDFKYIVPQGSPMFGIGNKFQKVSLSNCFVIKTVDSYGGICRADERIAQIAKRRGGIGLDISPIRPKGVATRNSALTTDGITVFMERFSNTSQEVAQAGRRGALMETISVHHPEIINFIRIKKDRSKITGANISVRVTDEFMEAVKKNKEYEVRWPVDSEYPIISDNLKAREVWDLMIESVHDSAEPGILFWDTIIRNSPPDSYASLGFDTISTNPCTVGDTLVYVADGRGNVPIRQLADEEKDVPVFCYDDNNKVTIRTMRNPRVTGYQKPIYKVTLDDGAIVRVTANHEFLTTDGAYKRVDELEPGDSLNILTRYEASIKDIFPKANSNSQDYLWINNGLRNSISEHRLITSYFYRNIEYGEIVHHIDYNAKNNSYKNLKIMSSKEHTALHSKNMIGDKNPMRRAKYEWSKEKWDQYRENMSRAVSGNKNGRFTGHSNEEVRRHALSLTKKLNRRFSKKEWQKYARDNKLPIGFSKWRKEELGSVFNLSVWAAEECNIEYLDKVPRLVKTLKSMLGQGYMSCINGNKVFVEKTCEECGTIFVKDHRQREISFCSRSCSNFYVNRHGANEKRTKSINSTYKSKMELIMNDQLKIFTGLKFELGRTPLLKEWEEECRDNGISFRLGTKYRFKSYRRIKEKSEFFNHRVISVELDGYEDVYNGTVDDFHNFFVGISEGKTSKDKRQWLYLNNLQCGELPLCESDSCRLMLLNLSSYVIDPFTKEARFDVKLFSDHVRKAMRLMDDLIDLELEAIEGIINKIKGDPEDSSTKKNEMDLWMGIRNKCKQGRRTGLGVTALGDFIAMLNQKYGSKKSIKIVDEIYSNLRNEAYRASIQLAKERGPFPIFDAKLEKNNEYIKRLPIDIRKEMAIHGRRNIGILTTAPAGSVSAMTQATSGFEPCYKTEYYRKRRLTDSDKEEPDFIDEQVNKWKQYAIVHHGVKKFEEITGKSVKDSPYNGAQSHEIDYEARIKMQATATQYVDHAISSTINLPKDIDIETVDRLYMKAWEQRCKGLTIYREGSREGILTSESVTTKSCEDCDQAGEELNKLLEKGLRPTKIYTVSAPPRLTTMECEIHRSKVDKGDWLFFIGLMNGQPYEVFGGDSDQFEIPHKYRKGWIIKNGKVEGITQYNLILGSLDDENEKFEFKGIAKHFNNYQYGAFTRLTSLALRHGTPIKYICEQITKTGVEGELFSFQRALSRVLKKYIIEGEKSEVICPLCGSDEVYYKNGCPSCNICGHSNCS